MSKKEVDKQKKKISKKKMILAVKIVKSKKSGSYTFENKMVSSSEEMKIFFKK
ncbi:DUF4295 family protein [Blattabacterium cuenoti]|uniref:DUF4295 family protein n=1 Tax=Blattabacterium cuenoti TaxID=1653831 RepID=UPI00163CA1D3|nr:DUF4295 family protein [Blattabacterium cuenoti]